MMAQDSTQAINDLDLGLAARVRIRPLAETVAGSIARVSQSSPI
jgi:hypothetical protein